MIKYLNVWKTCRKTTYGLLSWGGADPNIPISPMRSRLAKRTLYYTMIGAHNFQYILRFLCNLIYLKLSLWHPLLYVWCGRSNDKTDHFKPILAWSLYKKYTLLIWTHSYVHLLDDKINPIYIWKIHLKSFLNGKFRPLFE